MTTSRVTHSPTCRTTRPLAGLLGALTAASLALSPAAGSATTTYSYSGHAYTSIVGVGYSSANRITGSFTLAGPLAANLGATDLWGSLIGFSFGDGVFQASGGPPAGFDWISPPVFTVATDAAGRIAGWDIEFPAFDGSGGMLSLVSLTTRNIAGSVTDEGTLQVPTYDLNTGSIGTRNALAWVNQQPGSWTISGTTLPVPEPASLPMLAGGVAVLAAWSRRRRPA